MEVRYVKKYNKDYEANKFVAKSVEDWFPLNLELLANNCSLWRMTNYIMLKEPLSVFIYNKMVKRESYDKHRAFDEYKQYLDDFVKNKFNVDDVEYIENPKKFITDNLKVQKTSVNKVLNSLGLDKKEYTQSIYFDRKFKITQEISAVADTIFVDPIDLKYSLILDELKRLLDI